MSWWVCVDASMQCKTQFINADLSNALTKYMRDKYTSFVLDEEKSEYRDKIFFEPGGHGPYILSQPKMIFELYRGSQLQIDCAEIDTWIDLLRTSKRRKFIDMEYIKLYSRFACLILTVPEKESLVFQMSGRRKEAVEETEKFEEGMKSAYKLMETGPFNSLFPKIDIKDISFFPKKDDDD
jgi:hypothetical protein